MHSVGASTCLRREEADHRPPPCDPVSVEQLQWIPLLSDSSRATRRQRDAHARSAVTGILRGERDLHTQSKCLLRFLIKPLSCPE